MYWGNPQKIIVLISQYMNNQQSTTFSVDPFRFCGDTVRPVFIDYLGFLNKLWSLCENVHCTKNNKCKYNWTGIIVFVFV